MFSTVRCIVFDAVGTLITPDPPVAEVYACAGRKHGSRLSVAEIRERFREAFRLEYEVASPSSEDEERRLWRQIIQRVFDQDNLDACFEELFEHFGRASSWRTFPDVPKTLSELRLRGYALGVASNFDRRLHAILDGHSELANLAPRVISSEVGARKTSTAFYRELMDRVNMEPQQILMVGDDWQNDVASALEAGLPAVHLDRSAVSSPLSRDNVTVISSLSELPGLLP